MKASPVITTKVVAHVARLANLTLPEDKLVEATKHFGSVLEYVSNIQKVNTDSVVDNPQNEAKLDYWREDVVDKTRTLSQAEALSNAPHQHDGFFVVNSILSE
jgi:aspartyl-tRNA(Asn)/glutamyl-tRNA(Gln) amidotransferase subunit C